jgi:hypothetical protein
MIRGKKGVNQSQADQDHGQEQMNERREQKVSVKMKILEGRCEKTSFCF